MPRGTRRRIAGVGILIGIGFAAAAPPAVGQLVPPGIEGQASDTVVAFPPHSFTPGVGVGAERPVIGLVLGGGGARGAAHIGVLEVLEELRVPVDLVVGTSMGALVGGLFAAGLSPTELRAWTEGAEWDELFRDRPPYTDLSFRRKREERDFPVPLEVGIGPSGMELPPGLISGQKLNAALRDLTFPASRVSDFDSLAVPFRAIATDLETGDLAVLSGGDLVDALRASMSAPGVFTPYPVEDRLLVDGGLLRNLPVDIARSLGADIIIAVDVGAELAPRDELNTLLQLTRQVTRIMTLSGATAQWAHLSPADILIRPALGDQGATDFTRAIAAADSGAVAARSVARRLTSLALDSAAYEDRRARRVAFRNAPNRFDFVAVGPYTGRSPGSLLRRLATRAGPVDTTSLHGDIQHLYGLGIYERVDYRVRGTPEGDVLEFRVREKPWGPAYMRFRLSVRDRLDGDGTYSVATLLLLPQLNDWGAELVGEFEVGEVRGVRAEVYQPLGIRGIAYVSGGFGHRTTPADVYLDELTVARFRTAETAYGAEVGTHLGTDVELALRLERGGVRAEPSIGPPGLEPVEVALGRMTLRAEYDGLDDPAFPRRGLAIRFDRVLSETALGAEEIYRVSSAQILAALTAGRTTLTGALLGSTSGPAALPGYMRSGLGGFLLLSGYQPGQVTGNHLAFGRAMIMQALGRDGNTFLGLSVEAGNAWEASSQVSLEDLRFSASAAVGFRTPLGPVYLGYGSRWSGDGILYLLAGRTP